MSKMAVADDLSVHLCGLTMIQKTDVRGILYPIYFPPFMSGKMSQAS